MQAHSVWVVSGQVHYIAGRDDGSAIGKVKILDNILSTNFDILIDKISIRDACPTDSEIP